MILYTYNLFIHSSTDRHFGCFLALANVNNYAVSMGVWISFQGDDFVFFPQEELLDHMEDVFLIF